MSTTQPKFSSLSKSFIPRLLPDLILTQSNEIEAIFNGYGCQTEFLPNGVDTQEFSPVSSDTKYKLRRKYRLPEEKFTILHVGHIKRGRNVHVLNQINQYEDNQVIVVGSTTTPMEQDVCHSLKDSGCLVWRTYFEDIQEIYALSDCYLFPTIDKLNSIEMPLSVMEAMSCNLPVLSTRYGALPKVFTEGEGFYFAEKDDDFIHLLKRIKDDDREVKTREKILPYSWENITQRLEEIYDRILS
ncbi:glycosyltransferase family 4 protein [Dehalococcoidia bacterium]|nr:glycosyltransferase family 4 protein [Dehalococcoidia bacterium]